MGVLGELGFMNAERRADKDEKWNHFGATWSIWVPFCRPLDFEGPPKVTHFQEAQHKIRKLVSKSAFEQKHVFDCFLIPKVEGPKL